jgi:hypothetical protein
VGIYFREPEAPFEIHSGPRAAAESEEMSDGDASLRKSKATVGAQKGRAVQHPSNKGFFIFMACCALGAVAMIALLVGGEIKGARVAPDIEQKAKILE